MKILDSDKEQLTPYLRSTGWLAEGESIVATEIPGAGNMNFTLRIKTPTRSFIIKQSRPYVEKYPQVAAPEERVLREAEFYKLISEKPELSRRMPKVLGVDEPNCTMLMEDLGAGSDFTWCYAPDLKISRKELRYIMEFAALLHQSFDAETATHPISNRQMRKLNHEHIFVYPYMEENGLDLDHILPGLQSVSHPLKKDTMLHTKVEELGRLYLADGPVLLHGDYFPGSWLKTADGIKIIDPEFCFFGYAEFEMGVTLAHLKMAAQPGERIAYALKYYLEMAPLDEQLCEKFTAIEVIRRISGLAQLPLSIDLDERKRLLETSVDCLKS